MEVLPHIDINEPERIAAILADPANFVWQAIDSETLGDWTPDLGLTGYVNPSIFRVAGVAQSGKSSSLRHRFWRTVEHQGEHTGFRYIGVVLYDSSGQECPMEFRLGADEIGRVEPTRHDNRVHLIVVDKQVLFRGEMEIFQLIAPGKSEYRIEQFVLLHERPTPSSFAPRIDRLTAQREPDGSAMVNFITSQVSSCVVNVVDVEDAHPYTVYDSARTVHVMRIDGLLPDRAYRLNITATEKAGEKTSAFTELPPVEQLQLSQSTCVPLELCQTSQVWPAGLPLTFGIPLVRGRAFPGQSCDLDAGGATLAAQTRVLSQWPDGSTRWLLVDAIAPSAPGAAQLRISADSFSHQTTPVKQTETGVVIETSQLRASFDTKGAALHLDLRQDGKLKELTSGMYLTGALADGRVLKGSTPKSLRIEEEGPQRSVILANIPVTDEQGVEHLTCHLRLHVYANQALVRAAISVTTITPLMDETKRQMFIPILKQHAENLSAQLGFIGIPSPR